MSGVNIHDKPPRPAWWRYVLCTPIGFMLTTIAVAALLAFLADGNDLLTRGYFVLTTTVVFVTILLAFKSAAANPPSWSVFYSDWAEQSYLYDMFLGDEGPVGMQSLIVLSCAMVGLSVWLESGLPEDQHIIASALGYTTVDSESR